MSSDTTSPRQRRAVRHVAALSSGTALAPALRVTLNFHPDRAANRGSSILEALAAEGIYRSQFVTGTSNGGLTAHPGGDRWRWESRIFDRAYDDAPAHERPVYGALNFRSRPAARRRASAPPTFASAPRPCRAPRSAIPTACSNPRTSVWPNGCR